MTVDQSEIVYTRDDLVQAFKRNQFTLYYQPIVSAKTARTVTVEALLRLRLPSAAPEPPVPGRVVKAGVAADDGGGD